MIKAAPYSKEHIMVYVKAIDFQTKIEFSFLINKIEYRIFNGQYRQNHTPGHWLAPLNLPHWVQRKKSRAMPIPEKFYYGFSR